jgi:FAD/FMN-containing dehydrogenase
MSTLSWGCYPQPQFQNNVQLLSPDLSGVQELPRPFLPRGLGRSYGDSCLISHGTLVEINFKDHDIEFDSARGWIKVQAGTTLGEIIRAAGPKGWFLGVTPGTQFVTVGGAIANDVHGKNHHLKGSFGHTVVELEILRSSGEKIVCSRIQNSDLFSATIGGLGLTGIIVSATLQLQAVRGPYLEQETLHFEGVEGYLNFIYYSTGWP